ncbi:MAG: hypothetical protein Q8N51_12970, partial [Gammaproteobacteria bacterium]|nr:hypothetical protein [Gammaproteobacteria bacterium]
AASSNWRNNYNSSISSTSSSTVLVNRADGKILTYTLINGQWTSDSDITDTLIKLPNAVGWKYTTSDGTVETYNIDGKLQTITNRAGLTQTLAYDVNNRLWKVTDPSGRQLTFVYVINSSNATGTITDPHGGQYITSSSGGNLTSVTYPDGQKRIYLYENTIATTGNATQPHALTGIINTTAADTTGANGTRYASYWYDTQGRAYKEEMAPNLNQGIDKNQLAYTVDANTGSPIKTIVTDALSTARTYNFTTILGVVKSTGQSQPGGSGCGAAASAMTYDANGNVASRTDFNGNQTCYAYDMGRNLETVRAEGLAGGTACPADLAAWTPITGTVQRKVVTQWHASFRLPTVVTEAGKVTGFGYDSQGNLLGKTVTDIASGQSRTWSYSYTTAADGTLVNLLKTVDGPRTEVADVATYGYAANGDLASVTNA